MIKKFTSEYVTPGHPDKVADIISDSILDLCLRQNPLARVAVETMVKDQNVVLAGEVSESCQSILTSSALSSHISSVVKSIGYNYKDMKFTADDLVVIDAISYQSSDIYNNTTGDDGEVCAGDQGIMFGAADARYDRKTYMPIELCIAKELALKLYQLHNSYPSIIYPDGKTQVTCSYDGQRMSVDTITISVQHNKDVDPNDVREIVVDQCINEVMNQRFFYLDWLSAMLNINAAGPFTIGGPDADTGLTGRKIVVDGYGGKFPVGGGAFSGKDPSKVDRSGALMARQIALTIVFSGLADVAQVQLAYEMGKREPTSLNIKIGSPSRRIRRSKSWADKLADKIISSVDLSPQAIINNFGLQTPMYQDLATYGHFGRPDLPWEKPNTEILKLIYTM